jgi:hypothetical protein
VYLVRWFVPPPKFISIYELIRNADGQYISVNSVDIMAVIVMLFIKVERKNIYISKYLFFIICLSESDNKKRTIKTTHIFESIQASVDLFRHHWHVYRYHRKFPNHISILFLKNVIQLIKYSNIFNNKFDKNLPIQRLYGHLNHIQ